MAKKKGANKVKSGFIDEEGSKLLFVIGGLKITKKNLFSAASIIFSLAISLKFMQVLRLKGVGFPLSYSITAIILSLITTHALSIRKHRKLQLEVNISNLFRHRLSLYVVSLTLIIIYYALLYFLNGILLNFNEVLFLGIVSK